MSKSCYIYIFLITITTNALFTFLFPRPILMTDASEYNSNALNIIQGNRIEVLHDGIHQLKPPLYPAFLAGIYYLFGHSLWNVYIVQIFLTGIISIFISYLTFKIFCDKRAACLSGIFFSFHLQTLIHSGILYAEILFSFCLILFTFSVYHALLNLKAKWFILSGFLIGITTMVKTSAQFLPLFIIPVIFLIHPRRKLKGLLMTILFTVAFLMTMTPWIARNYRYYDSFVFCSLQGGMNLYISNYSLEIPTGEKRLLSMTDELAKMSINENISWVDKDRIFYQEAIKMILKHPFKMVYLSFFKSINFFTGLWLQAYIIHIGYPEGSVISYFTNNLLVWIVAGMNTLLLLLAIGNFIFYREKSEMISSTIFLTIIGYFTLIHTISACSARYSLPVYSYIIIFAANSLSKTLRRLKLIRYFEQTKFNF